jgi:hypothetical protein
LVAAVYINKPVFQAVKAAPSRGVQSLYLVPGLPFEPVATWVCVVFTKKNANKNIKEKKKSSNGISLCVIIE